MLRVRVLGGLELEVDGERLPAPAGRPARALLAWLALHPGTHQRGRVAAALWPDVLDASARASLRTALAAVRRALGPAAGGALRAEREALGLSPAVAVDVLEFDALIAAGRPADALALADGELLPDLDHDWTLEARDRHRDRRAAAMAELARAAVATGDDEAALRWARGRAELDPYDEGAHRDLIALVAAAGDRAGAVAAYERFSARLRRELAVVPSAATRELAARLRADDGAPACPDRPPLPARLAPRRWRSAFVGRTEALARLGAAWAAVQAGGLELVLVVGEPGIGKTRLVARFAGEAHEGGATVIAGRAEPEPVEPYEPIADALRGAGLPPTVDASSDDRAGRLRRHEALADALEAVARGRALVLVLDDLHWADAATLDFLHHLAARGTPMPMLVLATCRPGEPEPLARALAEIGRDVPVTRVKLGGLSLHEAAALVADRAGAPGADVEALARRTGGNPFFLEALVDAGLTGSEGELPAGVAALLAGRLDWLGPRVTAVLEAAAILGHEFDVGLAAATARLPTAEALAALDAATAAHLVVPAPERPGRMAFTHALVQEALAARPAPGARARLHARVVEALDARVRGGSDEALAAAARHALAAVPALAAERAVDLAERAGVALVAAYAPADGAELLARAATLSDDAGEPPARRARVRCGLGEALHAADRPAEAGEAFATAAALARRAGDGDLLARAALGRSGPAVTIVRVDRERVAALEEALAALPAAATPVRARVAARLAIELAYDADHVRRDRLSEEALSAARAAGDARTLAAALGARHVVLWGPDHTPERLPLADEMVALARRARDDALELQGRTWRIVDLDELGDGPALEAELDAYAATAARSGLSSYAWYVPAWRSVRAGLAGRLDELHELLRRALAQGRRAGDANVEMVRIVPLQFALADERPQWVDLAWQQERIRSSPAGWAYRSMYTWVLAATGREDDARRELAAQRAAGAPASWPRDTNWLSAAKELSEAAALLGDLELGSELEALLAPFADRMVVSARGLFCMGAVAGALGRLADLAGDPRRAAARYAEAVERDERAGAAIWAAHHRRRLGDALLAAGDGERGRETLARAERDAGAYGLHRQAELARARLAQA
jgi:DNA-binding SARP family transcriptional activator